MGRGGGGDGGEGEAEGRRGRMARVAEVRVARRERSGGEHEDEVGRVQGGGERGGTGDGSALTAIASDFDEAPLKLKAAMQT